VIVSHGWKLLSSNVSVDDKDVRADTATFHKFSSV